MSIFDELKKYDVLKMCTFDSKLSQSHFSEIEKKAILTSNEIDCSVLIKSIHNSENGIDVRFYTTYDSHSGRDDIDTIWI